MINYDTYAQAYDSRYITDMCLEENEAIRDSFLSIQSSFKNSRIIDMGCGTGFLLDLVGTQEVSLSLYMGVDISREMTEIASKKYPDSLFITNGAENVIKEVSTKHDVIVSLFSIPYFGADAIKDIHNVLKVGGYFFVVYYRYPFLNPISVYAGKEKYYTINVLPQVNKCIKNAEKLFTTVYKNKLTSSGAYDIALFQKTS